MRAGGECYVDVELGAVKARNLSSTHLEAPVTWTVARPIDVEIPRERWHHSTSRRIRRDRWTRDGNGSGGDHKLTQHGPQVPRSSCRRIRRRAPRPPTGR